MIINELFTVRECPIRDNRKTNWLFFDKLETFYRYSAFEYDFSFHKLAPYIEPTCWTNTTYVTPHCRVQSETYQKVNISYAVINILFDHALFRQSNPSSRTHERKSLHPGTAHAHSKPKHYWIKPKIVKLFVRGSLQKEYKISTRECLYELVCNSVALGNMR